MNFFDDEILPNFFDEITLPEPTQADLEDERNLFLDCCGSCINFISFYAEAGFCKIAECNCICKNPKAMIDIWDKKCDKWIENEE